MPDKKGRIDWILLIFLILFTNQAVFSVKLLGLLFIYLFRFNLNFGFTRGRLPRFYPYIVLLSVFTFLVITREFSKNYTAAFLVGNAFWIFSLAGAHQVKLSVERYGFEGAYKTIKAFTLIHFLVCIGQLINLIRVTGAINPYDNNLPFPYGMSAGDNIYGIFMENSYYSIMVSCMLAVFFLFQRNLLFATLATTCMILVFGNFGTIIFLSVLLSLFLLGIFFSGLRQRDWFRRILLPGHFYIVIPFIFAFIATLYINLSPPNYQYVVEKVRAKVFRIKKDDKNSFTAKIENQKIDPKAYDMWGEKHDLIVELQAKENATPTIVTDFTSKNEAKKELTRSYIRSLAGKNLSVFETMAFLKSSPQAFLFGAGTARFSSTATHKMSGLDSSRLFSMLPKYRSEPFEQNHYILISEREKIGDDALKSTANWPDSLYNQLLGEYGVIGTLLFLFFYIGYFLRQYKKLTYGIWLIFLLLPLAHLNYTFDTLCVIPFFELLLFADLHKSQRLKY